MKTFNIKTPVGWELFLSGEKIKFDVDGTVRLVTFTVNSTAFCDVYVSFFEDMKDKVLLAASSEMFTCSFSTAIPAYVEFVSDMGAKMYVKGPASTHVVAKSIEETFTNVMPIARRNSDMDRMMYLSKLNERKRDEMLKNTLDEIKASALAKAEAAQVIDPAPTPAPKPEDKPDAEKPVKDAE